MQEEEITFSLQSYDFNFNDFFISINKELGSEALVGLPTGSPSYKNVTGYKGVKLCHSNELFIASDSQDVLRANMIQKCKISESNKTKSKKEKEM